MRTILYLITIFFLATVSLEATAISFTTYQAKQFSGTALGAHSWGRDLRGNPTSCQLIISEGVFEQRSIALSIDVDAVTPEGEHRSGYSFYKIYGARIYNTTDPYNWERNRREGSSVILERSEASYGKDEIVYYDRINVTLQAPENWSQIGQVRVKVVRTYTNAMTKYERASLARGSPGDVNFDPKKIGVPIELMNTSCSNFSAPLVDRGLGK